MSQTIFLTANADSCVDEVEKAGIEDVIYHLFYDFDGDGTIGDTFLDELSTYPQAFPY